MLNIPSQAIYPKSVLSIYPFLNFVEMEDKNAGLLTMETLQKRTPIKFVHFFTKNGFHLFKGKSMKQVVSASVLLGILLVCQLMLQC